MMKTPFSLARWVGALALAAVSSVSAQTFVGTNAPNTSTNFNFTLGAGATNLSLQVSNTATLYSHLLLARGRTPTDTDFDFVSRLDGTTNQVVLEAPEFAVTNYGLRVKTPSGSLTHAFRVTLTTNRSDTRSAQYPTLKPLVFSTTGTLTNAAGQAAWHYFQVDVPTNLPGWRLVLSTSTGANADFYVRRGALPTTGSYTGRSLNQPVDTIILDPTAATAGTYFIGVNLPSGPATNVSYTISGELGWLNQLTWDSGTVDAGTQIFTNQSPTGGDYYFHVTTASTASSAWRTALRVLSGEADVYLKQGSPAQTNSYTHASTRVGSDGVVLAQGNQFSAGQDWYLTVHATPGAQWTLLTGEAYVQSLPNLAADGSSGASAMIGPEGMRFFRTTISAGTLAWRLWLNGLGNQLLVHKTKAPLPISSPGSGYHDWTGAGQLLLVPPYLVTGDSYFVGVIGAPGTSLNLDSRQQPITDWAFGSQTNFTATGFGYQTFRVQVPVQQIAWQINLTPTSGDANLAVRRDNVPNEFKNDAFSDLVGSIGDSVTLVPAPPASPITAPGLSDGTFYVTIYGVTPYTCTATNGMPVITDVNYVFAITNDAPARAGWRFYRVTDTAQQLGTYGWDLALSNHFPNTEIALRQNAVPGRWSYRNCTANCSSQTTVGYVDYSGTQGFLQRPGHQADVWYIGVYQPAAPLGSFTLTGQQLTGTPLAFDSAAGSSSSVANQPAGKWQYFIMEVPTNALGWDLRLTNVTSGDPRLVVCRDRPPYTLGNYSYEGSYWYPYAETAWPSGYSWAAAYDWAGYSLEASGTSINGRILQMGMGNPLSPGTYYVGIRAPDNQVTPLSYTFLSRGIGTNFTIPVNALDYAGSSVSSSALATREVAYFSINVPSNVPSWKLRLNVTNEAMLAIQRGALPNVACGGSAPTTLNGGRKLQKLGDEEYLLLPMSGQSNVVGGTYYLAVVSEGQNPVSNRYGSNTCGFTLTSFGAATTNQMGVLNVSGAADLVQAGTLEGGEIKFHQFTVPPGVLAMEVRLENRVANPRMTLRADGRLPASSTSYGRDFGQSATWSDSEIIRIANPVATNYTIAVQADSFDSTYADASYTVRIHALTTAPLAFDGGLINVINHTNGTWRYFALTVPAGVLGWDVRLTNAAGNPRLVVRRDLSPDGLGNHDINGSYWYAWSETTWPSGSQWAASADWTGWTYDANGSNRTGQILQMGMGNPLEPGQYILGVIDANQSYSGGVMSYSLLSRGIGTNLSIRVLDLPFLGSVASNGLPAREVAYYRVQVPPGQDTWKLRLEPTLGEAMLMLQKDYLPNVVAGASSPVTVNGGHEEQKSGADLHLLYPRSTEVAVTNGTYYVAVASEGLNPVSNRIGSNTCSFTLQSLGPVTTNQLGTVDPSGLTDITQADSLEGGDLKFYQFTVPAGTLNLEVRLENRVGNPYMHLRTGKRLIRGGESYGQSDGIGATWTDNALINLVSPTVTNYTLAVQARSSSGVYSNAAYTIRLHAMGLTPLAFNNGVQSVSSQAVGTWRYFTVTVPPDALGWDLRLTNVTSGDPRLVIRRDTLPDALSTHTDTGSYWYYYSEAAWPSGYQVHASSDWTGWSQDNNGANSSGRVIAVSMGNPLSPGNYIIGVKNDNSPAAMTYQLFSRGIGTGYAIPVGSASFVGSLTNNGLAAREAAYYRLEVPPNQPNWKLRLASTVGESLLMLQRSNLPNVVAAGDSPATLNGGRKLQKAGNEHYLLLPEPGQTNIPGGTYYVAIASEGQNPAGARIGSNTCSSVLTSYGPLATLSLGNVGGADLTHSNNLGSGETRLYDFNVPAGTAAVELRLDNAVGTLRMTLRAGSGSAAPYFSYGRNGGQSATWNSDRIITLPNLASGLYSLTVQADSDTDASYLLRVRHMPATNLAFDASLSAPGLTNVATVSLADQQMQYFRVTVPTLFKGQPVLGWKLDLDNASGNPRVRVRKDILPTNASLGNTPYATSQATIVPPYLTPGTWYVEVQGQGASTFTLRSSGLLTERPAWAMPQVGGSVITPGLAAAGPLFGDTGIATNGVALPLDQGVDLEQGRMHYYAITIPSNNVGIIRTRLDAISGNPNLYLRADNFPTLNHYVSGDNGSSGACYDRYLTDNTGSEYGNWVPLDGRYQLQLPPGTWYLAVHASGNSNVRYRLRCYTGIITPLAFDGVNLINQSLAGGDWRYYQVKLPTNCPTTWNVTFAQNLGDVLMYIRDTTPPGHGVHVTDYRDWSNDNKNHGPYSQVDAPGTTNLACPPLRPGHTYYLGFRAVNDATFSLNSTTNTTTINYTNLLAFYGGSISNASIPPNGVLKLRIDVPADARRLLLTTVCSNTVSAYLSQGSVPTPTGRHDTWSGTSLNRTYQLYNSTWPWIPGYMYFLLVSNTTAVTQNFTLAVDGRNAVSDDYDADGLPDAWELACWPSFYTYNGTHDPDGDGVKNAEEYAEGTIPCDSASFRPRLSATGVGGVVTRNPAGTPTATPPKVWYDLGQNVQLTATPNPGYSFLGWAGDASGGVNPLTVLMDAHKTVTANFGITNHSGADYQFQMNLNSSAGVPPALQNIGAGNIYVSDSVDGCLRTVLRFPQGNGLLLQPTSGVVPTNVYTVVMLFRFDAVSSWRRVLDFKAGASENGLYIENGRLNFYPVVAGPAGSVLVSNWVQVVVTRDVTDTVSVYANGVPQFSFGDPASNGVISSADALRFFKDNTNLSEESAGFVARIRLYAAAMTPVQVAQLDRTDCAGAPHFLTPWFDSARVLNLPVEHVTPGVPYRLLASTNLTTWQGIATNAPLADPTTFTDPKATNHPNRMYRLVAP